ncbi:MAG: sulfotransferase [Methylococcaceae bacterium]|nr:sulfotransferase [Methylococcaceae bacterium]MDP3903432.1 sulfotransferase [Methylococcaceae bacterium]
MVTQIHFISGLPRSGSTLLCALLRQNPRFTSAMTSPVAALIGSVHPKMCGGEFGVFFDDAKRAEVLRGIFNSYYSDVTEGGVVFDTNRTWTGRAALLSRLYPQSRIICCVRETGWIIDSIESALNKHPLQLSRMFDFKPGMSVYARAESLMNSDTGQVGIAWSVLREAWFGSQSQRLLIVSYERLVRDPKLTLQRLYNELEEPFFEHDFDNVAYDEPEYDAHIGMPGLHKVRPKVDYQPRQPVVPPDLFAKYSTANFWDNPKLNPRGVTII